ncbi:MAG: endonuclease MutS2 [Clostridia bacterium]
MACSGLNIPADESSSIHIFDNIFADIGDDQSIADSLSTFSSHITNIVDIIKNANENSLILVDELGSGTDPVEGANLAISILDYFQQIHSLTIATTHYPELKKYALVTPNFENASVEFDIETLSPTYKLLIGVPGKSNAFEISRKLGLSDDIINKAKNSMSSKDIEFEELLKSIYYDKLELEREKEKISIESKKISALRIELENQNTEKIKEEKEIIKNAKIQARNILLEAKEDANDIINKLSSTTNSKDLNKLRNSLNDKIKQIKTNDTVDTSQPLNNIDKEKIKIGANVFVNSFNQPGIIMSNISKNDEVQVQIGSIKISLPISSLTLTENKEDTNTHKHISGLKNSFHKSMNVKPEINVIGMNVEEATFIIDKYLDDCSLAKLNTVRIIHGKGTGKLKNGIHNFLRKNPHVSTFRMRFFWRRRNGSHCC